MTADIESDISSTEHSGQHFGRETQDAPVSMNAETNIATAQ
jgi:hypothetical protein